MEFTTTDGKLIIEGTIIRQRRLTNRRRTNIILFCYFLFFVVDITIDKINIATETDRTYKWISVFVYGVILLCFIGVIFDFLFKQYLKTKVDISKVEKIKIYRSDEGLETSVVLTMKSKRYKCYTFRTLENQHEPLLNEIHSLNSNIKIIKE